MRRLLSEIDCFHFFNSIIHYSIIPLFQNSSRLHASNPKIPRCLAVWFRLVQIGIITMSHPTLLVVKSDEKQFQQLKKVLELKPYRLSEVSQNRNILAHFEREKPDLVIVCASDANNGDGLQVVKSIRHRDRTIPIILVTQYSSEVRAIAALRAGINDYFKVPYSGQSMLRSIARHLPKSAATKGHGARLDTLTSCPYGQHGVGYGRDWYGKRIGG